jgi:SH3-like domain-containing protein
MSKVKSPCMNMVSNNNQNGKFSSIYKGRKCRLVNEYKVWRKIQFEDGSTLNVLYNELNLIQCS